MTRTNGTRRVPVALGPRSYTVHLTSGWPALEGVLTASGLGPRALLVTDDVVDPIYAKPVQRLLKKAGLDVARVALASGESRKSLTQVARLYESALDHRLDRGDTLIALGGGIVGDTTGFAAATLYRGIRFVQLPTTLLAMVDASVGGKTGVNLARGKNLVGAFHQPKVVYVNLDTLSTLPAREIRAGISEVIKSGMIRDAGLVRHLEGNMSSILALDSDALGEAIERSVRVKARIVAADEREMGVRALLNYGHTIGHAVETVTRYRRFLHGEAVALGMIAAARLGAELGVTGASTLERQRALIASAGLPTVAPGISADAIAAALRFDKKVDAGRLRFVLTSKVGSASVHRQPKKSAVRRAIAEITSS